jgi:hypothetical protein
MVATMNLPVEVEIVIDHAPGRRVPKTGGILEIQALQETGRMVKDMVVQGLLTLVL